MAALSSIYRVAGYKEILEYLKLYLSSTFNAVFFEILLDCQLEASRIDRRDRHITRSINMSDKLDPSVPARYLVWLAERTCPRCLFSDAAVRLAKGLCAANTSIGTCLRREDYVMGTAFGSDYLLKDGFKFTDPRRYDFDLLSREELSEILRRNA